MLDLSLLVALNDRSRRGDSFTSLETASQRLNHENALRYVLGDDSLADDIYGPNETEFYPGMISDDY